MKKFFVLMLLCMHLFYIGGYNLFFQYFIRQSEDHIVQQIDENRVDASQLVQVKLPVHMPEIKNWADYKKIEGQIQFKNNYYNYIGVKLTQDTMYLVCIANKAKTRLVGANIKVAKTTNDIPASGKKGAESTVKKAASNFEYNITKCEYKFLAFQDLIELTSTPTTTLLTNPYIESPGKPPNNLIG